MSKALDRVRDFYSRVLHESPMGRDAYSYLSSRGFTDEIISEYGVGYSPNAVVDYLGVGALNYSDLVTLTDIEHLFQQKNRAYADRFKGRITFPLINVAGQTLGFAARQLDGSLPKYLNSSESEVYQKSRCLYGVQLAAEHIYSHDYAILCEGYTDAMAFRQTGHKMAVACGGTYATKHQLAIIARYTNNLYLAFDADDAGEGVTIRTDDLARSMGFNVGHIEIEAGKDPAEALLGV